MAVQIELEREADGRWLAEVPSLAGLMTYGASREEAVANVQSLVLQVHAERLEQNEAASELPEFLLAEATAASRTRPGR